MNFGKALEELKEGKKVTREAWGTVVSIEAQFPDENSKMTKPYIYMNKGKDKFPCDLSCESIFAEDWVIVE